MFTNLTRRRAALKSKITTFQNYLRSITANTLDPDTVLTAHVKVNLQNRVEKIATLIDDFDSIQNEIEVLELNAEQSIDQIAQREEFENTFYSVFTLAKILLANSSAETNTQIVVNNENSNTVSANIESISSVEPAPTHSMSFQLPRVEVPKFNGNRDDWLEFKNSFASLVHENLT